jgi:hypothetical protein
MLEKIRRIFFVIAACFLCFESMGAIYDRDKLDFIASFDNIVITKFDLDNMLQISQHEETKKDKSEKKYVEILDEYINLLVQEKIIRDVASVKELTKKEEADVWSLFSGNFKTMEPLEKFCNKKGLDAGFFRRYLNTQYLWKKFIENELIGKVKVDDFYVGQFVEFSSEHNGINTDYYNLLEIIIYYNNPKERIKAMSILDKVDGKNFNKYLSKYSQGASRDNGGYLGWFSAGDLSTDIAEKIKKVGMGGVTDTVCIEKTIGNGSCFVFKVNETRSGMIPNDNDKKNIKTYIRGVKLEEKVKILMEKTRKNSQIKIR